MSSWPGGGSKDARQTTIIMFAPQAFKDRKTFMPEGGARMYGDVWDHVAWVDKESGFHIIKLVTVPSVTGSGVHLSDYRLRVWRSMPGPGAPTIGDMDGIPVTGRTVSLREPEDPMRVEAERNALWRYWVTKAPMLRR